MPRPFSTAAASSAKPRLEWRPSKPTTTPRERAEILRIHVGNRGRDPARYDLPGLARKAAGFSGSELEQLVVTGLHEAFAEGGELEQRHLERAAAEARPLSITMREEIARLREWASTRTRQASSPPVEGAR